MFIYVYKPFKNVCKWFWMFFTIFINRICKELSVVNKRACLDCGDIVRGRADKKFCSDQCRNNYNNRLNKDNNQYVRNVHSLLRRNRRILSDLYIEGKKRVHRDALFALGYNFNFFTHTIETEAGVTSKFCYEYGYAESEKEFVELHYNGKFLDYS